MKITLRQIQFLRAAVEHGSFSRAAESLGTSQPALSQAIREMEVALGLRLFDRTTRRLHLTEAGRVLWSATATGLSEIERGVADLENLAALRAGSVTVVAPPLLAATVLPELYARVARAHPGLQLRLSDEGTDQILSRVRDGRADLGLGTFRTDEEGIVSTPVLSDDLMAFAARANPVAGAGRIDWRQLAACRIVALSPESSLRLLVDAAFDRQGLRVAPAVEVHQVHTAIGLVAATDLVAILPAYARRAVPDRPVVALPIDGPPLRRDIAIIRRADRALSPAAAAVAAILREVLRDLG